MRRSFERTPVFGISCGEQVLEKRVRVVIPVYKQNITAEERLSLESAHRYLKNYGITFLAPEDLNLDQAFQQIPEADECRMPKEYFDGFSGYNHLMLSKELYERFSEYESILICQTDVLVLEDRLESYLTLHYDYIGAPMPHMGPWSPKLYTGNGGFSLRRVSSIIRFLTSHGNEIKNSKENEDVIFSNAGENYPNEFKTAPVNISAGFAFNMYHEKLFRLNGSRLPMAIHGYLTGDIPFLNKYIFPGLEKNSKFTPPLEDRWTDDWEAFCRFVKRSKILAVYGAGDAALVFREIIERLGGKAEAFLVSDDQVVPTGIEGIPVYHLSEYAGNYEELSVFIAISTRYKELPDFEGMLRGKGVKNVLRMSNELWHRGINELIGE